MNKYILIYISIPTIMMFCGSTKLAHISLRPLYVLTPITRSPGDLCIMHWEGHIGACSIYILGKLAGNKKLNM